MSNRSTSVAQAIDPSHPSKCVAEAIDRLRESVGLGVVIGNYHYQAIANGPVEQVLAFNNDETIQLITNPKDPNDVHFSSHGVLTDLARNRIPGSRVETTFPVDPKQFPETTLWPPEQKPPWDAPPVNQKNTTGNGYSKQAYFFNGHTDDKGEYHPKDYLVTVGPSLPKIARIDGGAAQFWVASIGVISQGVGIYKGAHGMSVYIGSAYLPEWPDAFDKQVEILKKGFSARIGTYFKFVLPEH